jgi:hypothetical protein
MQRGRGCFFTYCIRTFPEGEGTVFFSRKYFIINAEESYKRTINCTMVIRLRNIEE